MPARFEKVVDLSENPRITLCTAPDHEAGGSGDFEYTSSILGGRNVAVGQDRYGDARANGPDRVVFRCASELVSTRAPMNRQCGDSTVFCDLRDSHSISALWGWSGADLEGHRHTDCLNDGIENVSHQRLVLQQGGAGSLIADFLCGTTHVDINDLRAGRDIVGGCFGQPFGVTSRDLDGDGRHLTGMVSAQG